jgi:hypothetical protein
LVASNRDGKGKWLIDRLRAIPRGAVLPISIICAAIIVAVPATKGRFANWWGASADSNSWLHAWQEHVDAGGPEPFMDALSQVAPAGTNLQVIETVKQAAAGKEYRWDGGTRFTALNEIVAAASGKAHVVPDTLFVYPAPFTYRIEQGTSILQQLTVWAKHAGWGLDWQALEEPLSSSALHDVSVKIPVDWPSPNAVDFGQEFDNAFTRVIAQMNQERFQQGKRPITAIADFWTARLVVKLADDEMHQAAHTRGRGRGEPSDGLGASE